MSKELTESGPNLTLFELDESLLMLLEARDDLTAALRGEGRPGIGLPLEADERAERQAELAEVERLLAEYREQLPAKVDRIRGLVLHARTASQAHREEASRQSALARMWEVREEQVLGMIAGAIERVPERKRLNGSAGYFLLKGNGGVKPLVVTDEAAVPEECVRYAGWIAGDLWRRMLKFVPDLGDPLAGPSWNDFKLERTVDGDRVRKLLAEPCGPCRGTGIDPTTGDDKVPCRACAGDGKTAVPGAHLAERGRHVEVK